MKKQIDAAVREKLDQIKPKIQDIPNTVPDEMRRTLILRAGSLRVWQKK